MVEDDPEWCALVVDELARQGAAVRGLGSVEALYRELAVDACDIVVLDELKLDAPKTKLMAGILNHFNVEKALVVTGAADEAVVRAANNIPGVKTLPADCINVYDLLNYTKLVITQDAVKKVEEVFA